LFYVISTVKQYKAISSFGILIRLRAGRPRLGIRQGQGLFLFVTASKRTLRST